MGGNICRIVSIKTRVSPMLTFEPLVVLTVVLTGADSYKTI